ncbi:glycosyltransferase family 4 protein [Xanthomonas sacchari]|uniref:glycosyltransferase family 4 protein n=1 Tax=Xanthomonas sacchari TaxID=56458 RepID=UPI002252AFE8|nr:glycosyltransferase family 4 protein [Xanthomonas sacchari]MCW0372251.1 D-inositol-3-phosphate glycosyltransferase [Xanthomonas sacchari]
MDAERPLRILMTADTVGGVWQYALSLCRVLTAQGDRVELATMGATPTPAQWREAAAIQGLRLHASGYRLLWMDDPWADVSSAGRWLQALAAQVRPDVVHLNDYAHGALAWPAPVLMTAHSCVGSWWQAVRGEALPPEWDHYRATVAAGLAAADHVVAPTQAMLAALRAQYPLDVPCSVIANGTAPLSRPVPASAKQPLVLAAGRLWDEAKNLRTLAAVAPQLPWALRIAGEAAHPDGGTAAIASALRLGQLPPSRLRRWMARASVYALPARYEPFGLSALEAAQAGCALVLGDIPSLREVWGDAALYVAPDDARALTAQLQRLIGDPLLRQRMARRAVVQARHYTATAMAVAYRQRYRALIAHRGTPRVAGRAGPPVPLLSSIGVGA